MGNKPSFQQTQRKRGADVNFFLSLFLFISLPRRSRKRASRPAHRKSRQHCSRLLLLLLLHHLPFILLSSSSCWACSLPTTELRSTDNYPASSLLRPRLLTHETSSRDRFLTLYACSEHPRDRGRVKWLHILFAISASESRDIRAGDPTKRQV